jgi:hypothetical protein
MVLAIKATCLAMGFFRAGQGRQTYGGDRRYQQGFNNYNDGRRNSGYNGNYNSRRFATNTNSNSRIANSGYPVAVPGLSEAQQKLVSEAAEAFARQLAGRTECIVWTVTPLLEVVLISRLLLLFNSRGLLGCSQYNRM